MTAKKKAAAVETAGPTCVAPGCDNPVLHRGLCAEHWESPQRDRAEKA